MYNYDHVDIEAFAGKTFNRIFDRETGECPKLGTDAVCFVAPQENFLMTHQRECCERVYLEDVCGDWDDLIGSPVLCAEESVSDGIFDDELKSWTFYRLKTAKGSVTLRWQGESNGYYGVEVSLYKEKSPTEKE